jgi:hypothetical protein
MYIYPTASKVDIQMRVEPPCFPGRKIYVSIRISFLGRQIDENIATNFSGIDRYSR